MSEPAGTSTLGLNTTGSRRYIASYVGNSIRKHKTRSLSLLLGIVIGVCLVGSVFVWTDTGTRVAVDDYFEDNLFQYNVVQRYEFPVDTQMIFSVQSWYMSQSVHEASYVIYQSIGILDGTNRPASDPYLPYPYENNIKDLQTFFVTPSFLTQVESKFNYTGSFTVQPGQCLVSSRVVQDAELILNQTIQIGQPIDVAVASIYDDPTTIGDINRFNITNVQVVGIYNIPAEDTVLYGAFSGSGRTNYPGSGTVRI